MKARRSQRKLLKFVRDVAISQGGGGGALLGENPEPSRAWKEPLIIEVFDNAGTGEKANQAERNSTSAEALHQEMPWHSDAPSCGRRVQDQRQVDECFWFFRWLYEPVCQCGFGWCRSILGGRTRVRSFGWGKAGWRGTVWGWGEVRRWSACAWGGHSNKSQAAPFSPTSCSPNKPDIDQDAGPFWSQWGNAAAGPKLRVPNMPGDECPW